MKQVDPGWLHPCEQGPSALLTYHEGPPEEQQSFSCASGSQIISLNELKVNYTSPFSSCWDIELKQDHENQVTPEVTSTSKDI